MEYDIEPGKDQELVITLRMTPEERASLLEQLEYWEKVCRDTNSVHVQPRLLLFNKDNRHLRLMEVLNVLRPLTTDPATLRDR